MYGMASVLTIPRFNSGLDELTTSFVGIQRRCLNVVCVGAHPDDPETGCGGTLARLAADGHRVSIVYLTRGEAGIKGGDRNSTAHVRSAEALKAASVLGAQAYFANQI